MLTPRSHTHGTLSQLRTPRYSFPDPAIEDDMGHGVGAQAELAGDLVREPRPCWLQQRQPPWDSCPDGLGAWRARAGRRWAGSSKTERSTGT